MRSNRLVRLAGALAAPLLIGGAMAAQTGVASAAAAGDGGHHHVLYVSKWGKASNDDRSCRSAAFRSIQAAVNAAPARGTVVVCAGTYHEQVVLSRPLTLTGQGATIDEAGVTPGFTVTIPSLGTQTIYAAVVIVSSHVELSGFTIRDAQGEGVLAAGLGKVLYGVEVEHNAVLHNDLGGGVPPASPYFLCAPAGPIPGDCGEGVHFSAVAYSAIRDNLISGNSGGILMTDDTGPTHNNVVEGNVVTRNEFDCGITVPGHNPGALSATGARQPSVAGVYDNVIKFNVVTDNGLKGEGAGVLFANGGPSTGSYDNLVEGNYIAGNELSGVTMHAHTIGPGQFEDLNGNVIVGNAIGTNNADGDSLDGPPGPADIQTTAVLVFSGGTPVRVKVAHNHLFDDAVGVWISKVVTASGLGTNTFSNVTTPVSGNH